MSIQPNVVAAQALIGDQRLHRLATSGRVLDRISFRMQKYNNISTSTPKSAITIHYLATT